MKSYNKRIKDVVKNLLCLDEEFSLETRLYDLGAGSEEVRDIFEGLSICFEDYCSGDDKISDKGREELGKISDYVGAVLMYKGMADSFRDLMRYESFERFMEDITPRHLGYMLKYMDVSEVAKPLK